MSLSESPVFNRALAIVLTLEGGDSDHPHDRGGKTRYGISQRAYPELDIKALTLADAAAIYQRDYWLPAACPQLPHRLGIAVFDSAVNQGVFRAVRLLQEAIGVPADGLFGPRSLSALNRRLRTEADERELLVQFLGLRARHYHELVFSTPAQAVFFPGWLRRLFLLQAWLCERITPPLPQELSP